MALGLGLGLGLRCHTHLDRGGLRLRTRARAPTITAAAAAAARRGGCREGLRDLAARGRAPRLRLCPVRLVAVAIHEDMLVQALRGRPPLAEVSWLGLGLGVG